MIGSMRIEFIGDFSDLSRAAQGAAAVVSGAATQMAAQGKRIASGFDNIANAANRMSRDLDAAREMYEGVTRAGERMTRVGRTMTVGLTLPIVGLGVGAVKAASDFESLRMGMEAVTGSSEEAARQLARLEEIAKRPAVDYEDAIRASQGFQAIGKSAAFAERQIVGVANAVALSGGGATEFSGVMRQLRQVAGLGKLMGDELNIILETAPAMGAALQAAFGTTSAEAIRDLNLSTDEFFARLAEGMESLPQMEGGVRNAMDNAAAAAKRAAGAIGDELLPAVTQGLEAFTEWAEKVREADSGAVRWAISAAAVTAVLGPLAIVAGTAVTAIASVVTAAVAAGASLGAIAITLTGGVGLIALLGGLSAVWIKNRIDAAAAAQAAEEYANVLNRLRGDTVDPKVASATLFGLAQERTRLQAGPQTEGTTARIAEINAQMQGISDGIARANVGARTMAGNADAAAEALQAARDQAGYLAEAFEVFPEGSRQWASAMDQVATLAERAAAAVRAAGGAVTEESVAWMAIVQEMRELAGLTAAIPAVVPTIAAGGRAVPAGVVNNDVNLPMNPAASLPPQEVQQTSAAIRMLGSLSARAANSLGWVAERAAFSVSQLTPMGLAAHGLGVIMEALEPVINALLVPITIVAEVFAQALAPVLKMLFPVFKFLAIQATYIGQVFATVSGWIYKVVGHLVYGIGKFIDSIPGVGDFGLKKVGRGLIETGEEMLGAADAMAEAREEIRNLTWEDAMERATEKMNDLSEAVAGAVQGFRYQAIRHEATSPAAIPPGAAGGGGYGRSGPGSPTDTGGTNPTFVGGPTSISISTSGDGRETYENLYYEWDRRTRGKPAHDPARAVFLAMPVP